MKTILKIIVILVVASVVAGAFSLAINNSSTTSSSIEGGGPSAMTRPEGGDHDSGSITGGLAGILATLMKLTGITILVLLIEKGINRLGNRKLMPTQQ